MNARILSYIRPANLKEAIRLADDKLLTKKVLKKAGIPTPKVLAVYRSQDDITNFDWEVLPESFVVKPNRGLGGEGILIIFGRRKDGTWVRSRGQIINFFDILLHIYNIFDGNYSLANISDIAFIEERLKLIPQFKPYAFRGIPDIRVIVYNRVPVMAMMRLPTRQSDGKANLHLGGIGVGIDMGTGVTTTAVLSGNLIENAPESGLRLSGIKIPGWKEILEMAVKAQVAGGVGFLGVDIAIDREKGPVVLELNARPGLSIQVANLAPLKERLARVEGLKVETLARGVRLGQELFGGEIEQEVADITGRKILGIIESIKIEGKNNLETETRAKIDTGAASTSLDETLARQLGYSGALDAFNAYHIPLDLQQKVEPEKEKQISAEVAERHPDLIGAVVVRSSHGASLRPTIRVGLTLAGKKIFARATVIDRRNMRYSIIVGKRDLSGFLIDPLKGLSSPPKKIAAKKRLIISADDFGRSEKINQGIIRGIDEGIVTSVSVLINGHFVQKELLSNKNVSVGLHVELEEGEDTKQGVKVQIEKFEKIFGHLPAHLNGHCHCQADPDRINDFITIAKEYNIPIRSWKKEDREIIKLAEAKTPKNFVRWHPGRKEKIFDQIKKLPVGISEMGVNLGYYDESSNISYNEQREDELNIITSEEFKNLLKENKIILTSYSSLSK